MIPYGYCHCRCGQRTTIAKYTCRDKGWVKGEPKRYLQHHWNRHQAGLPVSRHLDEREGDVTPRRPLTPGTRLCLRCDRPFQSWDVRQNRLCRWCTEANASRTDERPRGRLRGTFREW